MPKIIFVNRFFHPDLSATSQMLSDLAFYLAAENREVCVLTSAQSYEDPSVTFPRREWLSRVRVIRIPTSRFGRDRLALRAIDYLTFYLGAAWHLLRLSRPGDRIVAMTDPPLISVVALAATLRGAVLVNWVQDLFPEVAESLGLCRNVLLRRLLHGVRNASLRRAQCNVVLGEGMARRVIDLGVDGKRVRVLHNWADGDQIRPLERRRNPLVDEWDLRDKFIVGYSGNMGRAHEFGTILEAAALLNGRPDIVFLFIGSGAQRARLVREVERVSLKNVVFKPYQPRAELRRSLCVPHVHLISLNPAQEGLIVPSKFYGIAAAGRPAICVGDPDGEIPRILAAEQCGWTFAVGQSAQLAGRIVELASHPAATEVAGARARRAFDARFDKPLACAEWRRLLSADTALMDRT